MPGATLSTLSSILKDMYEPGVNEQLVNDVLITQRLEARSDELFGNQAVVALHKSRTGGFGARPENGALPNPGAQGWARATFDLKFLYGIVEVTGPSRAKTRSEAGAWLESLRSELDGIRNDLANDLARQLYGSGDAVIATTGTNGSGTTHTLQSAEPIRKGFIHEGQVIDIGVAGDYDSVATARTITAVNVATPSITVSGANFATTAGDRVSITGSAVSSSTVYEVSGLQQVVATAATAFGGIDPSVAGNSYWDNLRDTTGGALTLDNLMKAYNQVRIAGGQVSAMISTFGLQRALFNLLQSQVRYVNPLEIRGGFQVLEFQGQPFIADRQAPFGKIFLLDERFLKIYSNMGWHFLDDDGSVLKWKSGFDAWQAVLARYMNLGATRRNVQMVMSGLTDTTGF